MHSTKLLLSITALAGTSLSQKSDSQFCSAYSTSFLSLIEGAPTLPPVIVSFLAQSTEAASPTTTASPATTTPPAVNIDFISHAGFLCELVTELPPSLLPDLQTYAAGLLSFGRDHSSNYEAYATDCFSEAEGASMSSYLNYIFTATGDLCQPTPTPSLSGGPSNGTYPTSPAPTATGSYSSLSSSSTLPVTAAAARPTGALLGAVAMGGVIGAAALL
ncbi:hypothetical protein F5Y14DRAFT_462007 [Nemania sp. NC0429]|nr:hypothetical protein F5Y14DRAFT_462007 [Nemania sp. NC0429]